ncbi:MAG: response regulator transcription factor [Gammaproteobacteria bacterium]|nr:MAG: response regulator transcription factor [Gammaproteobacteria bacterium]
MISQNDNFLLVDDDEIFNMVMQRALIRRGFSVDIFQSAKDAVNAMGEINYTKAIVDLKIAQESGLTLIKELKLLNPAMEIVMLTGYSSISTAVEAIKLGALNYFCKPVEVDEILQAFTSNTTDEEIALPENPTSLDRLEWEHIQKTLHANDGNISASARVLGMHRRTLQRKLQKRPVKN